jgi:outer membrane protein assembly factor BamA
MKDKVLMVLISLIAFGLSAQDKDSLKESSKFNLTAIPVVYFLPETSWAFGGAGLATFKLDKENGIKPSQFQFLATYTLKDQLLLALPFELYLAGDKVRLFGEFGYYKYYYNYFGGINSAKTDLENYSVDYPRFVLSVTRELRPKLYIGGQYKLDRFKMKEIATEGALVTNEISGYQGGNISAAGFDILYDSRNSLFSPTNGIFANLKFDYSSSATGASFAYQKVDFDVRYFKKVAQGHVLALNFYTGYGQGDIPVFQKYYMSSALRMRGFADRRFQDDNMAMIQAEYRYTIYKRITGTAFAGTGTVASRYSQVFSNPYKQAFGFGLRYMLNPKDLVNLRIDVAFTEEGSNFYLTVKEAF